MSEPQSMQWDGAKRTVLDVHDEMQDAETIVAWVKANGGEARYEEARGQMGVHFGHDLSVSAHIAVRTINGWAYAAPGDTVVMGETLFEVDNTAEMGLKYLACVSTIREFIVKSAAVTVSATEFARLLDELDAPAKPIDALVEKLARNRHERTFADSWESMQEKWREGFRRDAREDLAFIGMCLNWKPGEDCKSCASEAETREAIARQIEEQIPDLTFNDGHTTTATDEARMRVKRHAAAIARGRSDCR